MATSKSLAAAVALVGVGIILHALVSVGGGAAQAVASPIPYATSVRGVGPAPTVVWHSAIAPDTARLGLLRAWSDGTVEMKRFWVNAETTEGWCGQPLYCSGPWQVVSDPSEGLSAKSDSNFDGAVDGADLANLLASWGPAPRSPMPPQRLSARPFDALNQQAKAKVRLGLT